MKKFLVTLLIAGTAIAHVPVVTPSNRPKGDAPPKLERKPLPPIVFQDPITHAPIILLPW